MKVKFRWIFEWQYIYSWESQSLSSFWKIVEKWKINLETVAQYTWIKDCKWNEIYEGDNLKDDWWSNYTVKFHKWAFMLYDNAFYAIVWNKSLYNTSQYCWVDNLI